MSLFDRSLFSRTLTLFALRVPVRLTSLFLSEVTSRVLGFTGRGMGRGTVCRTTDPNTRTLLLSTEVKKEGRLIGLGGE